jgi:hypothetical protein
VVVEVDEDVVDCVNADRDSDSAIEEVVDDNNDDADKVELKEEEVVLLLVDTEDGESAIPLLASDM